jgi:hypothetical protein
MDENADAKDATAYVGGSQSYRDCRVAAEGEDVLYQVGHQIVVHPGVLGANEALNVVSVSFIQFSRNSESRLELRPNTQSITFVGPIWHGLPQNQLKSLCRRKFLGKFIGLSSVAACLRQHQAPLLH